MTFASELWVVAVFAAGLVAGGCVGCLLMAACAYGHRGDNHGNR